MNIGNVQMDASQTFSSLLRNIESSNFNYSMSKTPFSATISLKSSFVKRFIDDPTTTKNQHFESMAKEDMEHLETKDLKEENLALLAKVKDLEHRLEISQEGFEKKRIQLQTVYEKEKDNVCKNC